MTGTVQNLGIKNVVLSGGTSVGTIAAYANTIVNCYIEGNVNFKINKKSTYVGGLIGNLKLESGNQTEIHISNCYSDINVNIDGACTFGGIIGNAHNVGYVNNIKITQCYNIIQLKNPEVQIGGIIGQSVMGGSIGVKIEECYHIGDLEGSIVSGIANCSHVKTIIQNCYSIGNMKAKSQPSGIVGSTSSCNTFNCYSVGKIESN